MNHNVKTPKLQRDKSHREAMIRNLASSLIEHKEIKTTLAKAKALRPFVEKLVTLGKKNTLHSRRRALSVLGSNSLAQKCVKIIFSDIAKATSSRKGGYTRIIRLGDRKSDSAPMAIIQWVDAISDVDESTEEIKSEALIDNKSDIKETEGKS